MNTKLVLFIIGTLLIIITAATIGYKAVEVVSNYQDQRAAAMDQLDKEIRRPAR